jgi:hypothetical protein
LLTPGLKQSYALPENISQACMSGYDPQCMFLMSKSSNAGAETTVQESVRGLIVFHQESTMVRKPMIDEKNMKVEF